MTMHWGRVRVAGVSLFGIALCASAASLAVGLEGRVAWARPQPRAAPSASTTKHIANALDHADAQRFVLGLVNRDRKASGLGPVVLDEAASKGGLRHARDMAKNGFTGHIGSDGSTPEQRYTESGGTDFVQENAACLFDLVERKRWIIALRP